jgi:hypothetical protein
MFFHKDDYGYRAVGASGAVTGVIFSHIIKIYDVGIFLYQCLILVLFFLFSIVFINGMKAKTFHTAHFGGYRRLFDYIAQRTFIVSRSYVNGAIIGHSIVILL